LGSLFWNEAWVCGLVQIAIERKKGSGLGTVAVTYNTGKGCRNRLRFVRTLELVEEKSRGGELAQEDGDYTAGLTPALVS
jgi:hypothetical protein